MQPKLLIFDWDGTLADTTNPIIETVQQAFYECGGQRRRPNPQLNRPQPDADDAAACPVCGHGQA